MNPKIKEEILKVLTGISNILKEREPKDIYELRNLSNEVVNNAGIFQDEDSISIIVLTYAIYKLLERMPMMEHRNYNKIRLYVKNAKDFLMRDDIKRYQSEIKALFSTLNALDSRLKMFVEEVITKARVNKGGKLVEKGLSVGKAANLMGISQWELMSYIGKTEISDAGNFKENVKKRLKFAREMFP